MMRLLQLPEEVLTLLEKGKISAGHARAILMAPERLRLKFAQRVVAEKLSVRATEALASGKTPAVKSKNSGKGAEGTIIRSPAVIDLENRIRGKLGTKVKLEVSGEGDNQKGELKISFFSRAELESLIEKLGA
jgi:ParB family chromosome partitioning protein